MLLADCIGVMSPFRYSLVNDALSAKATDVYTAMLAQDALVVPVITLELGVRRSPLRFRPSINPVKLGKMTQKTRRQEHILSPHLTSLEYELTELLRSVERLGPV